jgi:DNA-binding IclR family transcriptional regulator
VAGLDRYTAVLRLFTQARSEWTVQEMSEHLGVPQSTAYRTVRDLLAENFLEAASEARYRLGSVFIEFERLLRLTDPLLTAGERVLRDVVAEAGAPCVGLLCRLYNDTVMCIDDTVSPGANFRSSYERGRPMPLTQGATSKVILAHLPPRRLNRLLENGPELANETFRTELQTVRRRGIAVSRGEIDADVVGIAAPIFRKAPGLLASLSLVLPSRGLEDAQIGRLAALTVEAARKIELAMDRPQQNQP